MRLNPLGERHLANLPRKTSQRVDVATKAAGSGRRPAVGASTSNRKLAVVKQKPPEPEPEPEAEEVIEEAPVEETPPVEEDHLLGDFVDHVKVEPQTGKLALKADEHLLSDKSLYATEDPLDHVKDRRNAERIVKPVKPAAPAPAPVPAKASVRTKLGAGVSNGRMAKAAAKPAPEPEVEEAEVVEAATDTVDLEVEEVKEEAPAKKGLSKKSLPIKRGVPPPKEEPEEAEAEDELKPVEAEVEEAEEEPAPSKTSNRFAKKGVSNRFDKKGKPTSKRVAEDDAEPVEDSSNRVSRRTTKRSIRGQAPGFKITLKHKILGGLAIFLILAVVIGYKPGMIWLYESSMTKPGVSVDARKSSAKSRFEFDADGAGGFFGVKLTDPDAEIREAAVYGLELLGKTSSHRIFAAESLANHLDGADAGTKALMAKSLGVIAQEAITSHKAKIEKEGKAEPNAPIFGEEQETIAKIGMALGGRADGDADTEVRSVAIEAMKGLRVSGVCTTLIKIAATDNGALKSKAMDSIPSTAITESIPKLLETMSGQDKGLSEVCRRAFETVRDQAKSSELAPLLRDPNNSDEVRLTLAQALAKRQNDSTAGAALISAFKDKSAPVRATAVKGIPITGIPAGTEKSMKDLITDSDESVRVETANALGAIRNAECKTLVLEAFGTSMSGKTLNAFIAALGNCVSSKDIKAITIVMKAMDSNPGSESAAHEALSMLSSPGDQKRVNKRKEWSTEKWRSWYANINTREKMRKDALEKIAAIQKHLADEHTTYPKWMRETETQLDILAKCEEMCKPDDPEDAPGLQTEQSKYSLLKEQFNKNASIDMRN